MTQSVVLDELDEALTNLTAVSTADRLTLLISFRESGSG